MERWGLVHKTKQYSVCESVEYIMYMNEVILYDFGSRGRGVGERGGGTKGPMSMITFIVFWGKLSQLLGIGECLRGPAGGDERDKLELVKMELQAAAVAL